MYIMNAHSLHFISGDPLSVIVFYYGLFESIDQYFNCRDHHLHHSAGQIDHQALQNANLLRKPVGIR